MLMFIVLIVLITALITVLTCTRTCTKQYGDVIEGFDLSCDLGGKYPVRSDALFDNLDFQIFDSHGKAVHKRRRNKQQVDVKNRAKKAGPQFIQECRDKCEERNCDMFVLDTKLRRKWRDRSEGKYYFNKCWVKNMSPEKARIGKPDKYSDRIIDKNRASFLTICGDGGEVNQETGRPCREPCIDEVNKAEDKLLYDRLVREKEGNPMPYRPEEIKRKEEYRAVYRKCLEDKCPQD